MLYAAIAPLNLVPAVLFFAGAEVVYARNFLLVYVRRSESGGAALWPDLAFFSSVALIIAQATMSSFLSVRGGLRQSALLVPLPFLTYFHYRRCAAHYVAPSAFLHRDAATHHGLFADLSASLDAAYYRQPALVAASWPPAPAATAPHRASFGVEPTDPSNVSSVGGLSDSVQEGHS